MPDRAIFLVDGFNLYHSVRNAGAGTRWLDLNALFQSYLYLLGGRAQLAAVHYFSALAHHLESKKPGIVKRHEDYVQALRSTGVTPHLARFKPKDIRCPSCHTGFRRYEEKETDVAIAAKMLELAATGGCDTVVLVSGDTDLIPAIRTARTLRPRMKVCVAFPHGRSNSALRSVASTCFKIRSTQYRKCQLPDPIILPGGRTISKPPSW